jgi:hypothetical protein
VLCGSIVARGLVVVVVVAVAVAWAMAGVDVRRRVRGKKREDWTRSAAVAAEKSVCNAGNTRGPARRAGGGLDTRAFWVVSIDASSPTGNGNVYIRASLGRALPLSLHGRRGWVDWAA